MGLSLRGVLGHRSVADFFLVFSCESTTSYKYGSKKSSGNCVTVHKLV